MKANHLRHKFEYTLAIGIILSLAACSDKKKADVVERATQLAHNSAQCPKLAQGYYNADNTSEVKFIEVYDNKEAQRLELNLNGYEQIPVNGKDTPQKNGNRLTGACIDKAVRIVGKDSTGQLSQTLIKLATDGGLQVEQSQPVKVPAIHYSRSSELKSTADAIKEWFTSPTEKKSGTGLPQQGGDQKPSI